MRGTTRFRFGYRRPPRPTQYFDSWLLHCDSGLIVLAHSIEPKAPIIVGEQEAVIPGDLAVWFLFKDEPFDLARIYSPRGQFRGFYVDALEPLNWNDSDPSSLETLIDLYLDMWISPNLSYELLDEDELEAARENGHVSEEQASGARETMTSIAKRLDAGSFPPAPVLAFDLGSSPAPFLLSSAVDATQQA